MQIYKQSRGWQDVFDIKQDVSDIKHIVSDYTAYIYIYIYDKTPSSCL